MHAFIHSCVNIYAYMHAHVGQVKALGCIVAQTLAVQRPVTPGLGFKINLCTKSCSVVCDTETFRQAKAPVCSLVLYLFPKTSNAEAADYSLNSRMNPCTRSDGGDAYCRKH